MNVENWKDLIRQVAEENDFYVSGSNDSFFVRFDQWHSAAFQIKQNSSGYLQAHQWEESAEEGGGGFGRAVYSIRSTTDAVQFCGVLLASATLRARRREPVI